MKVAAEMLRHWHREDPVHLLQAALWQAERLAEMAPDLEALRTQNASLHQQLETLVAAPQGDFPEPTPTKARVQEINKSRKESRSIVSAPVSGEQVCFPLAEQAALVLRQTEGRKDDLVALITCAVIGACG